MDDFIKQDAFFFITSIAVVLFTLFLIVGLYYLIKILRDIRYISGKAREGTDIISEDLTEIRENVKRQKSAIAFLTSLFKGIYNKSKHKGD